MTWVAGVDVGATSIRAALADESGGICGRASRTLPESRRAAVDTVRETVTEATAAAGVDPERIAAVGVGSMGPLDVDSGAIVEPPNASIDRLPVTEPISDVVDADVSLYNDATAGVIGEQYAADEDSLADHVLDHLAEWNARGVAINNPDRVVDPIRKRLPAHLVADPPEVAVASFGRDAVLRGAIAAVLPEKIM